MIVAAALSLSVVSAAEPTAISADKGEQKTRFLPMRQRINRNIDQNKFVYKGEVMLGLTASYGSLNSQAKQQKYIKTVL